MRISMMHRASYASKRETIHRVAWSKDSFILGKKCKISQCDLPDLQLVFYGIKMNLQVLEVFQKNNLLPTIKFR
jgi:hypothetical protein